MLSIPVVQQLNHVNFPTDHPLYLGTDTAKHAKRSDVIFLIDVDTPWDNASRDFLRPDAKIIHLERDPLFTSIPIWGFSADLAVAACSDIALPVLNGIIKARVDTGTNSKKKFEERRKKIQVEHDTMVREVEASIDAVKAQTPINPVWLSKCIGDLMDDKTIIVNEAVTSRLAEVLPLKRPGSLFSTPPAGHLGWGLGAAIGMKLGAPDGRRRLLHIFSAHGMPFYRSKVSHPVSHRRLQQPSLECEHQRGARALSRRSRAEDAQFSRMRLEPVAAVRADRAGLRRVRSARGGAGRITGRPGARAESSEGRTTPGSGERDL